MVCCYNSEKYLRDTIDSIINQTYKYWEIVAINDGSTDSTEDIILDYKNNGYPITYFKQKNKGFASARNKAIELSKNNWIAIIDHDDICMPTRLAIHADQINSNPGAKLFFADTIHFNNDGTNLKNHFKNKDLQNIDLRKGKITNYMLMHTNLIDTESVVFNKDASMSIGMFDTSFKYLVDYEYFLRMGEKYDLAMSDEVVSKWRVHNNQTTLIVGELFRIKESNRIIFRYLLKNNVPFIIKFGLVYRFFRRYVAFFFRPVTKMIIK